MISASIQFICARSMEPASPPFGFTVSIMMPVIPGEFVVGDAPARRPTWNKTFASVQEFSESAPPPGLPRYVSAVFSGNRPADRAFFEQLARAGGGDFIAHRGQMMESVLLSVLTKGQRSE